MKTLNSKQKKMQLHLNQDSIIGFAGFVDVYDSKIYVDTETGKGYGAVIKKLNKLINYLATKYNFNGFTFDDSKQNVIVHILEGIPKFDPRKNVKLSTFIQMRVARRLINELRNESRQTKNATSLNVHSYIYNCECNYSETIILGEGQELVKRCAQCSKLLGEGRRTPVNPCEILIGSSLYKGRSAHKCATAGQIKYDESIEFSVENDFLQMQNYTPPMEDDVIYSHDIQKWLRSEDPLIVRIIKLICVHDYSVKAAAEKVGISGAWANIKLKRLKNKHIVKEIFGRI